MGLLRNISSHLHFKKITLKNIAIIFSAIFIGILVIVYFKNTVLPYFLAGAQPVAYWKLDEGQGTVFNDSTGSNDGSISAGSSAPTWSTSDQCVSGSCLYFDGTEDYTTIADTADLQISGEITLTAWVKPNSVVDDPFGNNSINTIVSKWDNASNKRSYILGLNYNQVGNVIFGISHNGTNYDVYSTNAGTVEIGNWYYIAATYDGSNTYTIYVNGSEVSAPNHLAVGSGTGIDQNDTDAAIGSTVAWTGIPNHFAGYIDEVKIYNYERSSAQIKTDYAARGTTRGVSAHFGDDDMSKRLTEGLVGYWKMDEVGVSGSNWLAVDSSGNNNVGTGMGNASVGTTKPGKFGNAGYFDGNNDYTTATSSSLSLTQSFSLSSWVYTSENNPSWKGIIMNATGCGSSNGYYLVRRSGTNGIRSGFYDSGGVERYLDSTDSITLNSWNHVLVTYDYSTGKMIFYLNGTEDASTAIAANTAVRANTTVCMGMNGPYDYNGYLDEVRIYNRALDPSEAQALYNYAPGPVGHWKMDEGSGTSAIDSSGNGFNGILAAGSSAPSWVTGQYGSALQFDGTHDYVTIGDSINLSGNAAMTLSAWVYATGTPASRGQVIAKYDAAGDAEWYLNLDDTREISFLRECGSYTTNSVNTVPLNEWHHIAATYDGTSKKIYLDGVLENTGTDSCSVADIDTDIFIGSGGNGSNTEDFFPGSIDDVRVYNYARTKEQIINDMNASHPSIGTPVGSAVLHLKLDEGYGTTANDNSPQNHDGTISGATWTNDGKFGKALTFDGNDYIDMNTSLAQDSFSLSAWFKSSTTSGYQMIFSKETAAGQPWNYRLYLATSTGYLVGDIADGTNSSTVTNSTNMADGNWHHAVFTRDSDANILNLYIDGQFANTATDTTNGNEQNAQELWIGRSAYSGGGGYYFNGSLDDLRIYPFVLSSDQVRTVYNQGEQIVMGAYSTGVGGTSPSNASNREYCVPGDSSTCNSPIAEWLLEENTGSSAQDTSGNDRTGTLGSGNSAPKWVLGHLGKGSALQFDGTNDMVSAAHASALNAYPLTVEAWIKTNASSGDKGIVNKYVSSSLNGYQLFMQNGNLCAWYFRNSSNYIYDGTGCTLSTSGFNDNIWHHVTFTVDSTGGKLYVDGVIRNSQGWTGTAGAPTTTQGISMGYYPPISTSYLPGLIDQVRIYNYARTSAQIAWTFNRGAPVAHYKLDECTGTSIYDTSENKLNGTLSLGSNGETSTGTCSTSGAWASGAQGKFENSLSFDGSDDYVSIGSTSSLPSGNGAEWSISSWVKVNTIPSGVHYHIASIGSNSDGTAAFIGVRDGGSGFMVSTWGAANDLFGSTSVSTGQWYHVAGVSDGSNIRLYVNGKLDGGPKSVTNNLNPVRFRIGADAAPTQAEFFSGQIDDVKVFNYALTQEQIRTNMNAGAVRFQ